MVILVFNYLSIDETFDVSERGNHVRSSMPIRIVASHYCFSNPKLKPYLAGIRLYCTKLRHVLIPHYHNGQHHDNNNDDDDDDVNFELQTYGIPMDVCPMQRDGTWTVTQGHKDWLARQIASEQKEERAVVERSVNKTDDHQNVTTPLSESPNNISIIEEEEIRPSDVLFGRTKESRDHSGNQRLQLWVKMYFDEYEKSCKYRKVELSEKILTMVRASGGRFLKQQQHEQRWTVVDDDTIALRKIAHYFRREREKIREEEAKDEKERKKRSNAQRNNPIAPASSPATASAPGGGNYGVSRKRSS